MNQTRWQQIETLYHAALEHGPAERVTFLKQACGDDIDLLAEIESLLSSHEQADSFLAEPEFDLGLELLAKPKHIFKSDQDFGHFKILKFLGRGGMGEVYLAQDARLGRLVALKVLQSELASNQERIRRFIQEARSASGLSHPNILTIHEIGENEGRRFIASEFVEGETLRERLKSEEPLTLAQILEIALQIAAALNAANTAGIIHRDIKPENIMLREDGLVKVLDFGLAKLAENPDGDIPTVDSLSTNPGMILGTVAYMSPEQARGKKVDVRSDVWSFGVVLYEMLTGRLPFAGDTTSDIIAAILTSEPVLPDKDLVENPENLWQIAGKALRKDPEERYQSVKEMADDLRNAILESDALPERNFYRPTDFKRVARTDSKFVSTSETSKQHQTDRTNTKRNKNRIIFASILLLVLAGGFGAFYFLKNSRWSSREQMKITRIFDTGKTVTAAISPDGKYVVHAVTDAGKQSIWIKHLATNSNVQLVPPKSTDYPSMTFSKDGNYIYYGQGDGELYQTPVLGGESRKILSGVFSPISFSPDGQQFVFVRNLTSNETALMIANSDGSGERQIASRKKPEFFSHAAWSPDGKEIACVANADQEGLGIYILAVPVEGGSERIISPKKWYTIGQPVWLADGSGLIAPAIRESLNDPQQIWFFPASGGDARQITNDLANYGDASLTTDSNTLVTIRFEQRSNIWHLPQGKTEEARLASNNVHALFRFIVPAPDGRIIYTSLEESNGGRNIWIMNAEGTGAKQLTANAGDNILPCATDDGRYILFASNRADLKTYHIWRINIDGTNPVQLTNGSGERGPKCSPDGQTVVYLSGGPDVGPEQSRLWKISIDGRDPVQLTEYPTGWSDVSPDGKFIAVRFRLDKASSFKLGVIPITGGKPIKVFDLPKQNTPLNWKPDGRSIAYIKSENGFSNIWEQPVDGGEPRQFTKFNSETIYFFDWTKDGDLICTRGYEARDPVLISDFR
jgi:serine/threonine protein kinase